MTRFVEEHAAAGNLVVDHAERAAEEFLCLLRGTHQYALMLGLRPTPDETERQLLGISGTKPVLLYKEQGCEACNFMGFKGRVAVTEVLKLNRELDEMIAQSATRRELHEAALRTGFKELPEDGVRHVLAGTTSVTEISRVVDLTDRVV